jgi:hypothetical protein
MNKLEYLGTIKGQISSRMRRSAHLRCFLINQEPKSKKSISDAEKSAFRNAIVNTLKTQNKRSHRKDIILQIDFSVTTANPPAIHTLTKNYLDLMHKDLPAIDSHKGMVFGDDNQIKILIVNYHTRLEKEDGRIFIRTQSIGNLIKDLELTYSIDGTTKIDLSNKFDNSLHALKECREIKDILGEKFEGLELYWKRQIQENFLELHNVKTIGLIFLFRSRFSKTTLLSDYPDLQIILNENERLITFSTNFLELGRTPQKEGDTKLFKESVKEKLRKFKEKYKILFPLLTPIRVNILFIPPKSNVADLDNIARYIVPFVNEVFQPPSELHYALNLKSASGDSNMKKNATVTPSSISGYQIITIPRKEMDDENGQILFIITNGFTTNDLWWEIDEIIDNWEDSGDC